MLWLITIGLIFLAALFSGLNLGVMGLDKFELKRKADLGDKNARTVYAIRAKGNLLLVTLLTGNVAVISALSLVLDSVYHGLVAGILTTALITLFGEIIPQAILARYALQVGARVAWLVRLIMLLLYPVCGPVAWVLDRVLGDEIPNVHTKRELARLIEDHKHHKNSEIDADEIRIARGALSFGDRKISEVMTPRTVTYMVANDVLMSTLEITKIKQAGFSRIPVYSRDNQDDIMGMLYVKDLVDYAAHSKPAGQIARTKVYFVNQDDNLDDTLNAFIKTRNHLFVVVDEFAKVQGIVTIEDVVEEILDREITDEFDQYDDMRKVARRIKRPLVTKR